MSADGELFKDTFGIASIDLHRVEDESGDVKYIKDKKFDKVSRIDATSENYKTTLTLDVNTEIYPLRNNDRIEVLLATELDSSGADTSGGYDPTRKLTGRAAAYDYIMQGRIFRYDEVDGKAIVYASYGGLLMALNGEPRTLGARVFTVDSKLYLFLRKLTNL